MNKSRNEQDYLNLLTDSLKFRLKKIAEKILKALTRAEFHETASLAFVVVRADLVRFIRDERPHIVLRGLILEVCEGVDSFLKSRGSILACVNLKRSLKNLLSRLGAQESSFRWITDNRSDVRVQKPSKDMESQRMA